MCETLDALANLRRPRLLVAAARHGCRNYRRDRDQARLIGSSAVLPPQCSVDLLMSQEARLDEGRRRGDAEYSLSHHLDVLIALLSEARLLNPPAGQAS